MDVKMKTSNCKVKYSFVDTVDNDTNAGVDLDAGAGTGAGTDKGNSDDDDNNTDNYKDSEEGNSKDKDSEDKDSEDKNTKDENSEDENSEDNNDKIDQLEDTQNDKGDEQQNETNNEQHNNADNELHNNTTNNQSNDNVIISDLMGSILISRKTHASTAHPFCSKEANTDQKQRIKNRQNVAPTCKDKATQVAQQYAKNVEAAEKNKEYTSKSILTKEEKQIDIAVRDYYEEKCHIIEAIPNVIKHLCMSGTYCESKDCMINGKLNGGDIDSNDLVIDRSYTGIRGRDNYILILYGYWHFECAGTRALAGIAPSDKHTFTSDVTEVECVTVKATFRKAVEDMPSLPTPIYKEIPKGHKKDKLSKRTIIHAICFDRKAISAFYKQHTSYKEQADHLAARQYEDQFKSLKAKLAKRQQSLEKSNLLAMKLYQSTSNANESAAFLEQMVKSGNIKHSYKKHLMLLDQKEFLRLNMVATKAAVNVQMVLVNASKFFKRYPEIGEVFVKFAALIDPEGDVNKALAKLHKKADKDITPYISGEHYAREFKKHKKDVEKVVYSENLDEEIKKLIENLSLGMEESEIYQAQNPNDPNGEWLQTHLRGNKK